MCELMTILAAVVFTVLFFRFRQGAYSRSLFNTMMMFWGAALMWSVDCVFGLGEAEEGTPFLQAFFDLSVKDTVLGAIIVAFGLAFFALSAFCERKASLQPHKAA